MIVHKRSQGFTLLEVIVASAIFAVLATLSYSAINSLLNSRSIINKTQTAMQELQRVHSLMKNDLRFAALRSVRDELGDNEEALQIGEGDTLIKLTTHYPGVDGGELVRVVWMVDNGRLIRKQYQVLDRVEGGKLSQRIFFSGVKNNNNPLINSIEVFAYEIDQSKAITKKSNWDSNNKLPIAIEVMMELNTKKSYRWLFDLPVGFNQ